MTSDERDVQTSPVLQQGPLPTAVDMRAPVRTSRRLPRRVRGAARFVGPVLTLGFIALAAFAAFYTFPDVVVRPGSADPVGMRLSISGTTTHQEKGRVLWATVALVPEPRLLDMVDAWLRDEVDIRPRVKVLGNLTAEENRRLSSEEMDDSKSVASVVAARKLGMPTTGGGARIADTEPNTPAHGVLQVDDVVTQVDGQRLCLVGDLRTELSKHKPGDVVRLDVRSSKGVARTVSITTVGTSSGRPYIGVYASPVKSDRCSPLFDAKIDTARIGGPSAGLAMTLGIIDRLTEGELTGGVSVAATGTIEADGRIGPVGGVKQKTHAVRSAGAKLFIVPVDEVELARPVAGSMKVVGVRTLDDALDALRDLGGVPLSR